MLLEKTPEGKYIMRIDASLYKDSDCLRYVFYKLIQGLTSPDSAGCNPKTEYGTAFHKAMQSRYCNGSLDDQIQAATNHYKKFEIGDTEFRTIGHLVGSVVAYDVAYKYDNIKPMVVDGTTLVEQKFMYPFFRNELVEVLLCGTIDLVATVNDQLVIVDHKTTAGWDQQKYLAEYDLSPQLLIYKWVYDQLNRTDVGCLINGVFISAKTQTKFCRSSIINYSQEQVWACHSHLYSRVVEITSALSLWLQNGDVAFFLQNFCRCAGRYGLCSFTPLCRLSKAEAEGMAKDMYDHNIYDPMKFQE